MTTIDQHQAAPRAWRPVFGWLAIWLAVAGVAVVSHMFAFTQLSPVDEYQHVDYLDKTQRLELVNGGEKVGETAMREQACRGTELEDYEPPPCKASDLRPEQFPGVGFNHTYGDPPGYYAVTGLIAAALELVPGVDSLVTAGRLVGVAWLWGGLVVTFLLALRLGANTWAAAGATLLIAGNLVVVHASATVTTDAPALLVGGLVCLVALGVAEQRLSAWWLAPVAVLATAIKPTNLCVIGAALVFLLLQVAGRRAGLSRPLQGDAPGAAERRRRDSARHVRSAALPGSILVIAAAIPAAVWAIVTNAIQTPAVDDIPMFEQFESHRIQLSHIADNLFALVSPVAPSGTTFVPEFLYVSTVMAMATAVNVLLVLGVAGLAWFGRWSAQSTRLAVATTVSMVISGPVLVGLIFVSLESYYLIPSRYGLSLVAPLAACLAVAASRRRFGGGALVVLGLVECALLLTRTLSS